MASRSNEPRIDACEPSSQPRKELDEKISRIMKYSQGHTDAAAKNGRLSASEACRPMNRTDFEHRLSTFKVTNWHGKPHELRAGRCAARGWVCAGSRNSLRCVSCHRIVVLSNPKSGWAGTAGGHANSGAADDSVGTKGHSTIDSALDTLSTSGHAEKCPWRSARSPIAFEQIRPVVSKRLASDFRSSAAALGAAIDSRALMSGEDAYLPSRVTAAFWSEASNALVCGGVDLRAPFWAIARGRDPALVSEGTCEAGNAISNIGSS